MNSNIAYIEKPLAGGRGGIILTSKIPVQGCVWLRAQSRSAIGRVFVAAQASRCFVPLVCRETSTMAHLYADASSFRLEACWPVCETEMAHALRRLRSRSACASRHRSAGM